MSSQTAQLLSFPAPDRRYNWTAYLGMAFFLASWAMLFAGLFFVYGGMRLGAQVWPPLEAPPLPFWQPFINTIVIAASSLTIHVSAMAITRGKRWLSFAMLAATLVLGFVFLMLQLDVWVNIHRLGLFPNSGPYGSVFWTLTVFHALHAIVGVAALGVLCARIASRTLNPARQLSLRLWSMYWHFVGAIWAFMFTTVYCL